MQLTSINHQSQKNCFLLRASSLFMIWRSWSSLLSLFTLFKIAHLADHFTGLLINLLIESNHCFCSATFRWKTCEKESEKRRKDENKRRNRRRFLLPPKSREKLLLLFQISVKKSSVKEPTAPTKQLFLLFVWCFRFGPGETTPFPGNNKKSVCLCVFGQSAQKRKLH